MPLVRATVASAGAMPLESVRRAFVSDFYDSWNSIARVTEAKGRGNFMYGFMATNYLEWAATIAAQDAPTARRFAENLGQSDAHHFAKLPATWPRKPGRWFPADKQGNQNHLLWAVFDLVRNGLAHRYQQIDAELSDGRCRVQLIGAERQAYRPGRSRPPTHLRPFEVLAPDGVQYLIVRLFPDVLFADVDNAVADSGLVRLPPVTTFSRSYAVTIARLRRAIGVGKRRR